MPQMQWWLESPFITRTWWGDLMSHRQINVSWNSTFLWRCLTPIQNSCGASIARPTRRTWNSKGTRPLSKRDSTSRESSGKHWTKSWRGATAPMTPGWTRPSAWPNLSRRSPSAGQTWWRAIPSCQSVTGRRISPRSWTWPSSFGRRTRTLSTGTEFQSWNF